MYRNYINNHTQEDVTAAIADYGPYRFFITITFQNMQTDDSSREILSFIIRRAHKQLLGKRWKIHHKPLAGIVAVEYAHLIRKQSRDRGNCHFHILLKDHEHLPRENTYATESVRSAFISAGRAANHGKSKKPLGNNNIHCLLITSDGVLDYVTKAARESDWNMDERILFITDDGVS